MRPPPRLARQSVFHFLLVVPISGFLPLQYKVFKLLDWASRPLCADFSPSIQNLGRFRLLLVAPSNYRRRQRESFNAVEDL